MQTQAEAKWHAAKEYGHSLVQLHEFPQNEIK